MELTVKVATPQEQLTFSCEVHHTTSQHARLIESGFYEKNSPSRKVPVGDHHELELKTPVWWYAHAERIHWHRNRFTGRYFVCVTTSLPTIEQAKTLFENWCLGTAYTMVTGRDFTSLINNGDMAVFRDELEKHDIEIVR